MVKIIVQVQILQKTEKGSIDFAVSILKGTMCNVVQDHIGSLWGFMVPTEQKKGKSTDFCHHRSETMF